MRRIDTIVIHQSDSAFGTAGLIDQWHQARGWKGIGYHRVILNGMVRPGRWRAECDGMIQAGRDYDEVGAHVAGHNAHSVGICLIGKGVGMVNAPVGAHRDAPDDEGGSRTAPTWTPDGGYITAKQWAGLLRLVRELMDRFHVPADRVMGHREFAGVAKSCPGWDVEVLREMLGPGWTQPVTRQAK